MAVRWSRPRGGTGSRLGRGRRRRETRAHGWALRVVAWRTEQRRHREEMVAAARAQRRCAVKHSVWAFGIDGAARQRRLRIWLGSRHGVNDGVELGSATWAEEG
ncbi:hypothetical protein M0R45_014506 [Rubus argutus]|uniref:Uncharacterized protein n=1 Tax=Rubus argutus TaxID=59490 RepID=A0AAW1XMG1_RUBAR